jgi:hypothetical protein
LYVWEQAACAAGAAIALIPAAMALAASNKDSRRTALGRPSFAVVSAFRCFTVAPL